jgi:hypothetical protein
LDHRLLPVEVLDVEFYLPAILWSPSHHIIRQVLQHLQLQLHQKRKFG